jgi:hypothetical protein
MNTAPGVFLPAFVTQVNSEQALGIPARRFRELLPKLGVPTVRLGKLIGVETLVLLEALRARAIAQAPSEPSPPIESETTRLRRRAGLV